MLLTELHQRQRSISARVMRLILQVLLPFLFIPLTSQAWNDIMRSIFPLVNQGRTESSQLAREYYDTQRKNHGGTDRFDIDLPAYEDDWFFEAMFPSKKAFQSNETSLGQAVQAGFRAVKEVENGGRRTIRNAVDRDGFAVGWARVATGRETCGFCLMLVSRGPVYQSAESAGLNADDTTALDILDDNDTEAFNELMTRFHPNCDCKVVPVFDRMNWQGRDDYLAARDTWREVTKGLSGRDALNAFRRAIEDNQVDPEEFAVVR
jgi:hypothetical protein